MCILGQPFFFYGLSIAHRGRDWCKPISRADKIPVIVDIYVQKALVSIPELNESTEILKGCPL